MPEVSVDLQRWAVGLFDRDERYSWVRGPRGAGKSKPTAIALCLAMACRPLRVVIAREFKQILRDGFVRLVDITAADLGIPHTSPRGTGRITFTETGAELWSIGVERNPSSLQGLEDVDVAILEESQHMSAESLTLFTPTIRKPGSRIVALWNPWDIDTPIEQRWRRQKENGAGHHVDWLHWSLNPHWNAAQEAERQDWIDDPAYAWIYDGAYRPARGAIFHADKLVPVYGWETVDAWRVWDLAGSENPAADRTAGARIERVTHDVVEYVIADVTAGRWEAAARNRIMRDTALDDNCRQAAEITGSVAASKQAMTREIGRVFDGLPWQALTPLGSKPDRADGFAAAVNAGLVGYPAGADWLALLLAEMGSFPDGPHDDIVDACSHGYNQLQTARPYADSEFEVGVV